VGARRGTIEVVGLRTLGAVGLLLAGCSSFGAANGDGTATADGGTTAANSACAGKHTVCLSFDEGPPASPWNIANLGTTANFVSTPGLFVSPPSALETAVGPNTGSAFPVVSVPLPPSTTHVRCAATIQVTEVSAAGSVTVLRVIDATGASFVELTIDPADFKVDTSAGGHELASLQTGRFGEVVLDVSTTGTGSIAYTGPGAQAQFALPPALANVAFATASFGLMPSGSATAWKVYFDDLYCDVDP
jgi:hypothetical protein